MIGIIDYGMGNLYSVYNAFLALGAQAKIIDKPAQLKRCAAAILPGVGAFGDAMKILNKTGLSKEIVRFGYSGKPFMGICLGMQLLFERSEESPRVKGLGMISGDVVRFKGTAKIPQIGWNQILIRKRIPLLQGIKTGSYVFFCHSYYVRPKEKQSIVAQTQYTQKYTSIVAQGNVFGIQFHPEKSQKVGLAIVKNFISLSSQ